MRKRLATTVFTFMACCAALSGCGSGGGQQATVTIAPKPQSVTAGSQTLFSATMAHPPQGSTGIAWYLNPSSGAGVLGIPVADGTDASTISYTAPASAPSTNSITLTAYSIQDRSAVDTVTFTITGSALPAIQTSALPTGTVGSAYPSTTLQATGGTAPYTWSLSTGSTGLLPQGLSLSSDGVISGTPGSAGSFPLNLQVTDALMNSTQATVILTVNFQLVGTCGPPAGDEGALNGQFAFLLHGFDVAGTTAVIGSFTADGTGKIITGQEDRNINNGFSTINYSINPTSSNYTLDSHGRGCLTLATSVGAFLYRFSTTIDTSGSATQGFLIAFDSSGERVEGTFKQQDPQAFSNGQINGSYSFGVAAPLPKYGRFAAVGSFVASSGSITAGAIDTNQSGNVDETGVPPPNSGPPIYPIAPLSFTGDYSIAANGRGTITLNLADATATTAGTTIDAIAYVVSASELYLICSDPQPLAPFAGRVVQQTGAPYSASSLTGDSIRYLGGLSTLGAGSKEELALFTISSPGSFSYSFDYNDGGNISSSFTSGVYSVDPGTGRVNLSGDLYNLPVCYLFGTNQAFCMSTNSLVSSGELMPQAAGPYSSASITGIFAFGTVQRPSANGNVQEGVVGVLSPGNLNTLTDQNAIGSILTLGTLGSPTYFIGPQGTGFVASGASVIYLVSPQLWLGLDEGVVTNPTITFFQQ